MKIRQGFVSNSSSSSFVISRDKLTDEQIELIQDHIEHAQELRGKDDRLAELFRWARDEDRWSIDVTETTVEGSTWMDNFDMYEYLEQIGVKREDVEWEHSG